MWTRNYQPARNWSKKPKQGTSWAKYSRKRVNFKQWNKFNTTLKPDDSLDGVWVLEPATGESTYYTPKQWKEKEKELYKEPSKLTND